MYINRSLNGRFVRGEMCIESSSDLSMFSCSQRELQTWPVEKVFLVEMILEFSSDYGQLDGERQSERKVQLPVCV